MIASSFLIVGTGGFIGSITRYLVYSLTNELSQKNHFPIATLIVNALGSLLIGIIFALGFKYHIAEKDSVAYYLFGTGFLGAFTTFSTFSLDNLNMILGHQYLFFVSNVFLNIGIGLGCVILGYMTIYKNF
jgi:CrcB protein